MITVVLLEVFYCHRRQNQRGIYTVSAVFVSHMSGRNSCIKGMAQFCFKQAVHNLTVVALLKVCVNVFIHNIINLENGRVSPYQYKGVYHGLTTPQMVEDVRVIVYNMVWSTREVYTLAGVGWR